MKKYISLLLCLILACAAFTACGNKGATDPSETEEEMGEVLREAEQITEVDEAQLEKAGATLEKRLSLLKQDGWKKKDGAYVYTTDEDDCSGKYTITAKGNDADVTVTFDYFDDNAEMIDFYKIPLSQIQNIKLGADWTTDDGEHVPNSRLTIPADSPRSYAYISDTAYMDRLHEHLKGVNLLYHESTYASDNVENARKYNHSTAAEAATVARDACVGQLMLGHYSSRYTDEKVLLDEAQKIFKNTILSDENLVVDVK